MSGYVTTSTEYEVLDYVENHDKAFIDTGFIPNNNTGVKCKFKILSTENTHIHLFGSGESWNTRAFECYLWDQKLEFNYNSSVVFSNETIYVNDTIEIDWNKNVVKYKINNNEWKTINLSNNTFSSPYSMYVFLVQRPTSVPNPASTSLSQLYYFDLYDNGTLIKSYKPTLNTETNEICVFDILNNELVEIKGTNNLTPGPETGEYVGLKVSTRLKVNASRDITQLDYDLAECEEGWFSRYVRVNYLSNYSGNISNASLITTDIPQSKIGYYDVTFQFDEGSFRCMIGVPNNVGGNNYICWYSNALHEGHGGNVIDREPNVTGHKYRLIGKPGNNQSVAYRDGEFLKNYTSSFFLDNPTKLQLLGMSGYSGGKMIMYQAEFRESEYGEVVGKFIPCIRKSDEHAGLYDMVTKNFYEPGSGSFYPGPIITHFDYQKFHMYCARPIYQIDIDIADKIDGWFGEYIRCDYIESTSQDSFFGQQGINTGVYGTLNTVFECKYASNYTGPEGDYAGIVIGSRESATIKNIACHDYYLKGGLLDFGDYRDTRLMKETHTNNDILVYNSKDYRFIQESGVKIESSSSYNISFTTNEPIQLFQPTPNGFTDHHGKFFGKMYYCKIWDGDELVRDYIPCIRRSDLKAGLYDLVNCKFYISNSGYDFIPGGRQYEFNFIKY